MPQTPPDPAAPRLAPPVTRVLRLARWVVGWERLWPALVPPLGLAGIFVALALFDVLPLLPGWLHAGVLAAFAAGLVAAGWRGVVRLDWPDDDEAARRLERDSGLAHRPLAALADRLAADRDDPVAVALWTAHRRRMAALVARLRLAAPSPGMAARDPLGLRAAVILLLVVAGAVGGADAPSRLRRALSPAIALPGLAAAVEVWVTPPAYTGVAPFLLHSGQGGGQPLPIPAGSTVLAALTGGWGDAELVVDGESTPFERLAGGSQRIETTLKQGSRLAIRQLFHTVAAWPIRVEADALPSIEFSRAPEAGERGRLQISVDASDDYGIARAWVEIRRIDSADPPLGVALPLPAVRPRRVQASGWHDLTAHPWAGLPVSIRPMAEDTAGQVAGGEALTITLPERSFANPEARAVALQRRLVTEDRANAPQAAAVVEGIAAEPALFGGDSATFLALTMAGLVLRHDDFDLAEAQDLMWNAALRIEEGGVASARRNVDDARAALEQALAANAPAGEVQRLLDAYRAAVESMLDSLAGRAGQADAAAAPDDRAIGEDELKAMLDRMAGLAQSGARDALRRMLDQLSQVMDNLSAAPQAANPAAAKALDGLRGLVRDQRDLLDRSFVEGRRDPPSVQAAPPASRAQQDLRRRLDSLAKDLTKATGSAIPDSLAQSAAAMGRAAGALDKAAWPAAAAAQGEALQRLQEGVQQAEAQAGGPGGVGSVPRDPLGRPLSGRAAGDDGATRIPEHAEIQRSRQILDELRRREGEWQRPRPERDYLRRLLEQF
jgi:uncharacterized protein (TIGR02302 family)